MKVISKKNILIVGIILVIFVACLTIISLLTVVPAAVSVVGISNVQNASRDENRIAMLQSLMLEIEAFNGSNGFYPSQITKTNAGFQFKESDTPLILAVDETQLNLINQGFFCYGSTPNQSYTLGIKLVNESWYEYGEKTCTDENLIN